MNRGGLAVTWAAAGACGLPLAVLVAAQLPDAAAVLVWRGAVLAAAGLWAGVVWCVLTEKRGR